MILEIWTILNPIIKTLIYLTALYSIGSVLFKFHFQQYFNKEISLYCRKIIKSNSLLGILISVAGFVSISGNLGGNIGSIFELELIVLSLETMLGKSCILLIIGFIFLNLSYYFQPLLTNILQLIGVIILILSFIIVGHSLSKGIYSQILLLIHLFCISYWLGSFLPLRHMCIIKNYKNLHMVAHNFGVYATFYIVLLILTGLIFSYLLLGGILPIITSTYGNVLLGKILLVSILLLLGAINKFKIVPNLKTKITLGQSELKRSINVELILTFFILFVTSILTTSLPTPVGM